MGNQPTSQTQSSIDQGIVNASRQFRYPHKIITLLRHGQSEHNVVYDTEQRDPCVFDAPLTKVGHQQATKMIPECQSANPELIIVSPLSRALQTALLAFPAEKHPSARFEVWAEHTEHLEAACDIGSSKDDLQQRFPQFDFSDLPDVWWYTPEECDSNDPLEGRRVFTEFGYFEPQVHLESRIDQLVARLKNRPETRIALVGHADCFNCLLSRYFESDKWMRNCEIYTVVMDLNVEIYHPPGLKDIPVAASAPTERPASNVWTTEDDLGLLE